MTALAMLVRATPLLARSAPQHALAAIDPTLLVATNGIRLVAWVLALAVLVLWAPSGLRCIAARNAEAFALRAGRLPGGLAMLARLLHPPREGDDDRAGYLPLAIGVLMFQLRWFVTALTDLGRAQLTLVGQVAILLALAWPIYRHGRAHRDLTPGRAVTSFALMVLAGIGAAAVMR